MTPEDAGRYVGLLMRGDESSDEFKRLGQQADAEMTAEHQRALRDDPVYAEKWKVGMQRMIDEMDDRLVERIYRDLP
jgi:hypothetical protein